MNLPPMAMKIAIRNQGERPRNIRLWIPLFLVLPLVYLLIGCLVAILSLLSISAALRYRARPRPLALLMESLRLINAIKGTEVNVTGKESNVLLSIS